jgi:hypothetical protein
LARPRCGAPSQAVRTLGEAVLAIPVGQRIHLALPCHAALLERLTLPSTDREELAGMVQLQLEKTLPYPVEQVSSDFEVVHQADNESTLLSIATHTGQLEEMCQPLRAQARLPQKITLYAAHVAASCPKDQVVLCIWEEDAQLVVAICEQGKLGLRPDAPERRRRDAAQRAPALPARRRNGRRADGIRDRFGSSKAALRWVSRCGPFSRANPWS